MPPPTRFLLVVLALVVQPALAQPAEHLEGHQSFVRERWTVEDGLPVNHVNQLYQTPDGYIWMATFDGLVRFDGARFTVFNAANTPSLPSNRLVSIQPGLGESFWLTTEQNHLVRYEAGQISAFVSNQLFHKALVVVDGDSVLWVTSQQGLFREQNGRLVPYADEVIGNVEVTHALRSRSGALWVGVPEGVWKFDAGQTRLFGVTGLGPPGVQRLYEDTAGVIWAANSGLAKWSNGAFETVRSASAPWWQDDRPSVFALRRDAEGNLLISTKTGLFRLGRDRPLVEGPLGELENTNYPLEQGGAFSTCPDGDLWAVDRGHLYREGRLVLDTGLNGNILFCDQEGNLWLPTVGDGLYRFRTATIHTVGESGSLPISNLYGVFEDRSGSIWLGSANQGIVRLGEDGRRDLALAARTGATAAFLEGSDGSLWVGRHRCLSSNRTRDGGCARFEIEAELPPNVHAIAQTRDGSLWFGTNDGLFRRRNGQWSHFTAADGLPHRYVRYMLEARDGALWLATNGGGIARYTATPTGHDSFDAITADDGLSSNNVRGLYEDERGIIWIATEDRGLCRLDPNTGDLVVIRMADGLYDDGLHTVLEDDHGRLWMSTNRGLFWSLREELDAFARGEVAHVRSFFYTERDGMRNREANGGFQNVALKSSDGRLWFATQDGAVLVDPENIGTPSSAAPVIIEEIRPARGRVAERPDRPVHLAADQRSFTVRYTSPGFAAPERTRFRYRLEGFDEEWIDVDNRREAIYTNVPSGTYTLLVAASIGEGDWNTEGEPLVLTVAPYFYETWWFLLICILAGGALLAGVYEYRIRESRRREVKLQTVVDERTQELRKANDRMEEQADQLRSLDKAKSRFIADVSHEFRTPLTLTLGPIQDVREGRYGPLDPPAREQLDLALRNGRRLRRLTNQLLDLARIEAGQIKLKSRPDNLAAYLQTLSLPFVAAAERRRATFSVDVPDEPVPVRFDPEQLDKVFANLLSNALKFTPEGGDVRLVLTNAGAHAVISVIDTGNGILAEHLPHVFDRFYQAEKSEMQPGTGIGLSLAKELTELHGGTISVKSTKGAGSAFTVVLPLAGETASGDGQADPQTSSVLHADPTDSPAPLNEASDDGDDEPGNDDAPTVLLVDDNADLRAYVRGHLEGAARQYRVEAVPDGRAALEAVQRRLPDCIVSDVMMPHLNGFDFLKALRGDPETDFIPVVLLTARAEAEDRLAGLGLGADDYLTKPFDAAELVARVDNLIAQRQRLRDHLARGLDADNGKAVLHPTPVAVDAADAVFLDAVREAIEARLGDEDFAIEALVEMVGQSRSNLYRRLRELTGESPSELIRRMRLERGADLLRRQAGTVGEIAYAVGFKSVSHFSSSFRRHFSQTATAYGAEHSRSTISSEA